MARRHTAAAVDDGVHPDTGEVLDEVGRREVEPVGPERVAMEPIDGTRDVAGASIDRLALATEPFRRPGIDHGAPEVETLADGIGVDDTGPFRRGRVLRRLHGRHLVGDGVTGGHPGGESAVEDGHAAVPERTEHPPEA